MSQLCHRYVDKIIIFITDWAFIGDKYSYTFKSQFNNYYLRNLFLIIPGQMKCLLLATLSVNN